MTARRGPRWNRWLALGVGLLTVLVGLALLTRPFQSLAVLIILVAAGFVLTGIGDLADRRHAPDPRIATVIGVAWIVAGIAVLVWPGLSLRALAVAVGLALVIGGVVRALPAIRGEIDERVSALLLGAASVVLGLVSLGWPDVTLLVVAVVFGVRLVLFGLARLGDGIRGREAAEDAPTHPSRWRRYAKTAIAAVALMLSILLLVVSTRLNEGAPVVDAFYRTPGEVPAEPGALLRSEPFGRGVPDGARAWRILYTTTRGDGSPTLGSALVVAPTAAAIAPPPVIAWTHGTTGVDQTCAPSVLPEPFESGALFMLDRVIEQGWVLVATDYAGLGTEAPHAYLVGEDEGRSSLDAVRAARAMPELALGPQTVAWGHSQGGHAALWTGIIAPSYAPDVPLSGVAALAPASDLPGFAGILDGVLGGEIFASFIVQGYSDAYPDVRFDDYIRPTARIPVREIAARCLAEPGSLVSVATVLLFDTPIFQADPSTGPLAVRIAENVPSGPIEAPLLLAQGLGDTLILPDGQARFVQARCDAGGDLVYRTYEGRDHVGLVTADSPLVPELLAWTRDRLEGVPAASTC